ncbi:uncharacterized protein LOC144357986, partial [Saccoglossus kowalevskii]
PQRKVKENVKSKSGFTRPSPLYNKLLLQRDLTGLIIEALHQVAEDVNLKVKNSVHGHAITTIATTLVCNLQSSDTPLPKSLIEQLTSKIWYFLSLGDSERTYSAQNEMVWHGFFNMWVDRKTTDDLIHVFMDFLPSDTNIDELFKTVRICIFNLAVLARTQRDTMDYQSETAESASTIELSIEEEQALRYFAGYFPYNLKKKYVRRDNIKCRAYISILDDMRDDSQNVSDISKQWVSKQDRGGLFAVSDASYLFFKHVEIVCAKHLRTCQIDGYNGKNIQQPLVGDILSKKCVHKAWSTISRKAISDEVAATLLNNVVRLYVTIRCFSFAKSIVELYKSKKKAHIKGSKGLRKSLT